MNVVLIATYEMGRQPFGLASPAAWLRAEGAAVTCLDLFVQRLDEQAIATATLVAFYVPMHTATRIAIAAAHRVRAINPAAHLCFYGLYAPLNAPFLQELGATTVIGGEFEAELLALYRLLAQGQHTLLTAPIVSLERLAFVVPDRSGLPPLSRYAALHRGDEPPRTVGYVEASRGCKHLCRHCPVVPVYGGRFRIVPADVVLADIAQQVAAGAQHITFGDPDFFNGPTHALQIVRGLHERFPDVTYDATIKVEHLLKLAQHLPTLRDTGCTLVTSAVESVDDDVLALLEKGHTRTDFVRAVALLRDVGLPMQPTFVAFNPWITLQGYCTLLQTLAEFDLVAHVPSIQLAIRLLIPAGSRLLELPNVQRLVGPFDAAALVFPWTHPDPAVDALQKQVLALVQDAATEGQGREATFARVWQLAHGAAGQQEKAVPERLHALADRPIPWLSEPWYC